MSNESKPNTGPASSSPDPGQGRGGGKTAGTPNRPKEIGGPKGPEPTRYGDWERNGRVSDF